jgi:hypothetical protein
MVILAPLLLSSNSFHETGPREVEIKALPHPPLCLYEETTVSKQEPRKIKKLPPAGKKGMEAARLPHLEFQLKTGRVSSFYHRVIFV